MLNIDDRILSTLNEQEMFLCMHILKYMKSGEKQCWPSIDTLCKDCNWSHNTVKTWRKSLINKGVIMIAEQPGKPSIYKISTNLIKAYNGKIEQSTPTNFWPTNISPLPKSGRPTFGCDPIQLLVPEYINYEILTLNGLKEAEAKTESPEPENPKPEESKTEVEKVEAEIFSWANSTGAASIQNRYQQAKKQFSESEFQSDVIGFCGWHLTRVDEQTKERFKKDAAGFFYANLYSWLTNPNKRKAATQTQNQNNASGTYPNTSQAKRPFIDPQRMVDRAAQIVADRRAKRGEL